MILKEYPEIKKGDEVVASQTSLSHLTTDFMTQMNKRGYDGITFMIDFKRAVEYTKKGKSDIAEEEKFLGFTWTEHFKPEDMLKMVTGYMHFTMSKQQKMVFASQLQNVILSEIY